MLDKIKARKLKGANSIENASQEVRNGTNSVAWHSGGPSPTLHGLHPPQMLGDMGHTLHYGAHGAPGGKKVEGGTRSGHQLITSIAAATRRELEREFFPGNDRRANPMSRITWGSGLYLP